MIPGPLRVKLAYYISKYFVLIISFILLGFSVFFYIGAETFRKNLKKKNPDFFHNGDLVKISKVIDGDEMRVVNKEGKHTVLRLLGIKVPNTVSNTFLFPRYGEMCIKYIKKNFSGKWGKIRLSKPKTDSAGRLLATVYFKSDGTNNYEIDMGLNLIEMGYALTYVKYPFPQLPLYELSERATRKKKKGLWGNKAASEMALSLKAMWRSLKQ